jgi:hypothetical protein
MKMIVRATLVALAAGLPAAAAAQMPSYEPQQRMRTGLDTCMKTEVMKDAWCIRRCAPDFRMDFSGPKPRCIGTKRDARYDPPRPGYQPPKGGSGPAVPGA